MINFITKAYAKYNPFSQVGQISIVQEYCLFYARHTYSIILLFPCLVYANNPSITGNITMTNNYLAQGVSASNNKPAPQGNLQLTIPKGFYANFWGSRVNFLSPDDHITHSELELMLGNLQQISKNKAFDVFVGRYHYPHANDADYTEIQAEFVDHYFAVVGNYSYDIFGYKNASGGYIEGDIEYPLLQWQTLTFYANATLGHFELPSKVGDSYNYYYAGIDIVHKRLNLLLQYSTTSIAPRGFEQLYRNHWLATLNYYFGAETSVEKDDTKRLLFHRESHI